MATKISVPKRKNSGACKENAEKSYCFESTNVWTTNGLASKNKIRLSGCERIVFSLRLHHQRANGLHTKKGTGFFLGVLAKTQFVQNAKTQFVQNAKTQFENAKTQFENKKIPLFCKCFASSKILKSKKCKPQLKLLEF